MISVRAIYCLPDIKHVLYILSAIPLYDDALYMSSKRIEKRNEIEKILLRNYNKEQTKQLRWTIKLVREEDFLSSLDSLLRVGLDTSDPSIHSPQDMELLAINLVKTTTSKISDSKILGRVDDKDVIEVYV